MTEVRIEYLRPGKETTVYVEKLVYLDPLCLRTFKALPPEIVSSLARSLVAGGLIAPHQKACTIAKTYFFHEHFNLLEFYDENESLLGYYSDIGTPLTRTGHVYSMTDWFLDIWLSPDGRLIELDVDEFEEAVRRNLLSSGEADRARMTFTRLIREVREGVYPDAYRQNGTHPQERAREDS